MPLFGLFEGEQHEPDTQRSRAPHDKLEGASVIRFIIRRQWRDKYSGCGSDGFETIDIDVPELERILTDGGYGEGHFDMRSLAGAEVLAVPPEKKP